MATPLTHCWKADESASSNLGVVSDDACLGAWFSGFEVGHDFVFGSAKHRFRVASYGMINDRTLYFRIDYYTSFSLSGSGDNSSEHVFCGSESCRFCLMVLNLDS